MGFAARTLIVLVLAGGALLLWDLRQLVLLIFGALLLATVISAAAEPLVRRTGLGRHSVVAFVVAAGLVLLGATGWWVGGELLLQLQSLREQLPRALDSLRDWVAAGSLGEQGATLLDDLRSRDISWQRLAGAARMTLGALANAVLVLLMAVFLAAQPRLYRDGALRLLPVRARDRVGAALDASAAALHGWLKGQLVSMLFVAVATAAGLSLLGAPLALILGAIAGLLNFVPFVGPVVSGALAFLLAFMGGPQVALHVAILVLAIQQVEGNLLVPLLQRWAVNLPPALALVAVAIAAGIFGWPGILLATPMMVVAMVLTLRLYVEPLERG